MVRFVCNVISGILHVLLGAFGKERLVLPQVQKNVLKVEPLLALHTSIKILHSDALFIDLILSLTKGIQLDD